MTLASFASDPFTYPGGGIAAGVPVRVYFSDTAVNVAIFHDAAGAVLKTNPTKTDSAGVASFYVEPGTYDLWANGVKTTVVVSGPVDPPGPTDFITLAQAEALDDAVLLAAQDYADQVAAGGLDLTAYMKGPAGDAEKVWTWTGATRWMTIDTPLDPEDNGPDLIRLRNGTGGSATTPWRVNSNGENRFEPSTEDRHGFRAFEFANTGSSGLFASFSTNPADSGTREYLFGMRGTKAGVNRPGYGVFTRGIEVPQIRLNGVDIAPGAWTAPDLTGGTLWTADASGTYYALQFRIEGEWVVGSGRATLASPNNYVSGARILTLPAGMFPAEEVVMFVRSGGTGATAGFMTVSDLGVVSFGSNITNASASAWFQFDQFRMRRF